MVNQSSMEQLAKASRRAALVSFLGFLLVLSSIIYSAAKLHSSLRQLSSVQDQTKKLEQRRDELDQEIQAKEKDYTKLQGFYERLAKENPTLAREQIQERDSAADVRPQVSIYTADQSQMPKAKEIASSLREKGFVVSGIENASDQGFIQEQTEVRYFRYPEDKAEAQVILGILQNSFGITNSRPSYVLPEKAGATEPRQFEIWFKKDRL
jgi:hypothetical protein